MGKAYLVLGPCGICGAGEMLVSDVSVVLKPEESPFL